MGIESDKLVFDYLSRIGDLAHSTPMTAAERARLVSGLRGEIDRMRAEAGGAESKAAVKKILGRLGRPEDVVEARGPAAGGSSGSGSSALGGSVGGGGLGGGEESGDRGGSDRGGGPKVWLGKSGKSGKSDRGGSGGTSEPPAAPAHTAAYGPSGPHLAGTDELGPDETDPDWWRIDTSPYGDGGGSRTFGGPMPGFTGGIEVPELLEPPSREDEEDGARPGGEALKDGRRIPVPPARKAPETESGPGARPGTGPEAGDEDADADAAAGSGAGAGVAGALRRLLPGRPRLAAAGPRTGGVVELAAAALLVAGAAIGSLIPLGLGWLAAWWSPRLSRTEAKWAAAGMPGLVALGAAVWLWGRSERRWGEALPHGGEALGQALTEMWPVLLRVAAVASALFLVWRARRPRA